MIGVLAVLILLSPVVLTAVPATSSFQPLGKPFGSSVTWFSGFSGHVIFSNLTAPRGIAFDANQNILVVERGFGISALTQVISPTPGWNRTVVIENPDLTHGIQVDGRNLYVSTGSSVLVYRYDVGRRSVDATLSPFTLINGLPPDGPVNTHTLQLETDSTGKTTAILVGTAPFEDMDALARDPSTGRSTIRRYPIPVTSPSTSYSFSDGQTIAYGIRNPTGFTHYPVEGLNTKALYVVDNAAELRDISPFSSNFANDNPADELQLVQYTANTDDTTSTPRFFGYPDCATLWDPAADPSNVPGYLSAHKGTQISVGLVPDRNDSWCMNTTNNIAPVLPFQPHTSPLDIKIFTPSLFRSNASFPPTLAGDAFVSFHGSFGQSVPVGYGVVHVPFVSGKTAPNVVYEFLVQAKNLTACPASCIRPVGLAFGEEGMLYVSSDSSGEIFVIAGNSL